MNTVEQIESRIAVMIAYLRLRLEMQDWHGVMDAAADLRELEVARRLLLEGLDEHR